MAGKQMDELQAMVDEAFDDVLERELTVMRIFNHFSPIRSDICEEDLVTVVAVAADESERFVRETINFGDKVLDLARRNEDATTRFERNGES